MTTYVVAGAALAPVMRARDAFMDGRRAASTLITVPALARPEWLVRSPIVARRAVSDLAEWLRVNAEIECCYLTTTGRKSGRPHEIEIWFGVHRRRRCT